MQQLKQKPKKDDKLSFDEMIEQLEEKGITFEGISKEKAKQILMYSNFYYKIRSFRKNFPKNPNGKYINLDFLMLNDLATLDMRLRYLLIHMSLDIEHTLKTELVRDITIDENEDGKSVVNQFIKSSKSRKKLYDYYRPVSNNKHPNHGIYLKFNGRVPPVWVFCELITFGELVAFIEFYCKQYRNKPSYYLPLEKNLKYVKNIRNLTAHNSPIINEITINNQMDYGLTNKFLNKFLHSIDGLPKSVVRTKMTNTKVHDLCSLLYVYNEYITSAGIRENRYKELKQFMLRAKKNEKVYHKHDQIKSIYNFFDKIVDKISS